MGEDQLKMSHDNLAQWLGVVLDQVDYTKGACTLTEMVGACLPQDVIKNARATLVTALELQRRRGRSDH